MMNAVRIKLLFVQLIYICIKMVLAAKRNWLEDVTRADVSYSPALLTTAASSLVFCLALCSQTAKCKAATFNNQTRVCKCLYNKKGRTSKPGNRLWNRHFDGFPYDVKSDIHVQLFTDRKKSYAAAEQFCGTLGARLAVLDTMAKFYHVVGLQGFPDDKYIHIGANEKTEGVFVWNTGATITSNWIPGEPNNAMPPFGEDCVGALKTGFNDIQCLESINFVCEID